jgi:hypothetical protein
MGRQLMDLFPSEAERVQLREELLGEARTRLEQGATREQLVGLLHQRGLSIVESMWVIHQACALPLAAAKDVVTAHPVWAELVRATAPFHDELQKQLESEGTGKPGFGSPGPPAVAKPEPLNLPSVPPAKSS